MGELVIFRSGTTDNLALSVSEPAYLGVSGGPQLGDSLCSSLQLAFLEIDTRALLRS